MRPCGCGGEYGRLLLCDKEEREFWSLGAVATLEKTRIERHARPTKGGRGVIRNVKDASGKLLRGDPGKSNNKNSVLM